MSTTTQSSTEDDSQNEQPWYEQKKGLSWNEILRYQSHVFPDDDSWDPDVDADHSQAFVDRRRRREYHAQLFLGGLGYHYCAPTDVRGADWITVRNHSEYDRDGDDDRVIAEWNDHGFMVVDTVTYHDSVRLYYICDEERQ